MRLLGTDRYEDGTASDDEFGSNADFGFGRWTRDTADLRAQIGSVPRHVCRGRTFPARIEVASTGKADVRDSVLTVHLSEDELVGAGDTLITQRRIEWAGLGHAPHVLLLDVD